MDSVIHTYVYVYIYILFQILFHYRLLQDIEYISLYYTVGLCWLSILYTVMLNRLSSYSTQNTKASFYCIENLVGYFHNTRRTVLFCNLKKRWSNWPLIIFVLYYHQASEEGNGNPLQCSCLENPRDGGAWWAAVYGVAQSRTRLKRLSSSSSSIKPYL